MSGEQLEAACERTHETAAPPRTNGDSARNTSTAPYKARAVCEPRAPPHPTRKRSKRSNGAPRNGKICAPCMIRGVRAAKAAPSWQDLRAVRSRKAVCRAFQMHGAHILPKPAHFGCMAAISCRERAFSCPGLLRECIRAIFCQECGPSPVRECASKVLHSKGAPSSARNGSRKRFVQECDPSPVRERASKMLRLGPVGCAGERKMIIVLLCPR